ncbi:hypothetical protein CLOP_g9623 [Closterium sp. NIES-67]|nr:hypothetical protein CLOP_g9623 [Closterium sp. NIES-67]
MLEFEELIFEWDRVLRVGGVIWLEMFYAPLDEFPVYVALLSLLSYNRLHWRVLPKPDPGERKGPHVYLNCLLEKPVRREEGWQEEVKSGEGGEGSREERGRLEEKREEGEIEGEKRTEKGGKAESGSRVEGEAKEGRRSEEAGREEGSTREGGGREEGKREEGSREVGRREEKKREEGSVMVGAKEEEVREEPQRREEGGVEADGREEGRGGWSEDAGTSMEKFAREWYREEEGSREEGSSRSEEEKAALKRLAARVQEGRERKAWWRWFG